MIEIIQYNKTKMLIFNEKFSTDNLEVSDCQEKIIQLVHYLEFLIIFLIGLIFLIIFVNIQNIFPYFIYLLLFLLAVYSYYVYRKTIGLIQEFPESGSDKPHHAIIIAHRTDLIVGKYNFRDYLSGEDFLIQRFRVNLKKINYKVYEVNKKEEVIPIILDSKTTHLWIFGHGTRNKWV